MAAAEAAAGTGIGAALIGAGATTLNIGGGIFTNKANIKAAQKINNQNWENNWKMYQQQREDAAHAMQIRKADYEAAGLNPAMLAGGSGAEVQSGSASNMDAPHQEMIDWGQALEAAAQVAGIKQSYADKAKTEAETKSIDQENRFFEENFELKSIQEKMRTDLLELQKQLNEKDLKQKDYEELIKKYQAQVAESEAAIRRMDEKYQEIYNAKTPTAQPTDNTMRGSFKLGPIEFEYTRKGGTNKPIKRKKLGDNFRGAE